jgi:hypothetical protein
MTYTPTTGASDRRPRYVQQLARQQRQDEAELTALSEGLLQLRIYLESDKFGPLRPVNVNDVLLRLDEAVSQGLDARAAA